MSLEGLSINLATVREQCDLRQAVEACLQARHHRDRAVARPGREDRARRSRAHRARQRPARHRPLPRRHVPGARRRRPPARRSTTTSAPSTRRRRSAPMRWCSWSAGCRKARATSPARAPWCATASPPILPHARACEDPARDRAAASDVCRRPRLREHARAGARPLRRARRRHRRRDRHLSCVVGPEAVRADRARRQRQAHPRASHLRLAGADHATCCSTAA